MRFPAHTDLQQVAALPLGHLDQTSRDFFSLTAKVDISPRLEAVIEDKPLQLSASHKHMEVKSLKGE